MTDEEKESLICSAMISAQKKGIKISNQAWNIEWDDKKRIWEYTKVKKSCALGCIVVEYQNIVKTNSKILNVKEILKVNFDWVGSFNRGFDGYPKTSFDETISAFDIGIKLKNKFIQEKK
jgi:hypothetical protein